MKSKKKEKETRYQEIISEEKARKDKQKKKIIKKFRTGSHSRANPSVSSMARINLLLSSSKVLYGGRSRRLKLDERKEREKK
jgi:hypothetical protein